MMYVCGTIARRSVCLPPLRWPESAYASTTGWFDLCNCASESSIAVLAGWKILPLSIMHLEQDMKLSWLPDSINEFGTILKALKCWYWTINLKSKLSKPIACSLYIWTIQYVYFGPTMNKVLLNYDRLFRQRAQCLEDQYCNITQKIKSKQIFDAWRLDNRRDAEGRRWCSSPHFAKKRCCAGWTIRALLRCYTKSIVHTASSGARQ